MQGWRRLLGMAMLFLAASVGVAHAGAFGSDYEATGTCGGFPKAPIATPPWLCAAIVAGPDQGLKFPRDVLEIGPGHVLVTDMGGWKAGLGRILDITVAPNAEPVVTTLFAKLDQPNALQRGPDGLIYVGEPGQIWRFDLKSVVAGKEPEKTVVLGGLPKAGRHPLKQFVFDKQGNIILNIGAPTDRCEQVPGNLASIGVLCETILGEKPEAALWKLEMEWPAGKVKKVTTLAVGLRNSMALAVHPVSGMIVQGENSIDLEPDNDPPEELNVIGPGWNYGWPFCTGDNRPLPQLEARKFNCSGFEKPAVLVPGHAAPLGLVYYSGAMFPELAGKLIMSAHGYRANGHRMLSYDTAADGRPIQPAGSSGLPKFPMAILDDWALAKGKHPQGAPVAVSLGADGRIWFAEDRNQTIMMLLRPGVVAEAPLKPEAAPAAPGTLLVITPIAAPKGWAELYRKRLRNACRNCHVEFKPKSAKRSWSLLVDKGWMTPADLAKSKTIKAMRSEAPLPPMPPPKGYADNKRAIADLEAFLAKAASPEPKP